MFGRFSIPAVNPGQTGFGDPLYSLFIKGAITFSF